jgi:hypothetical protein
MAESFFFSSKDRSREASRSARFASILALRESTSMV